jgi:hypothetical protein
MRRFHKSIGPFASPPWVLVLVLGWLMSGLTPRFAVAESPPRLWRPVTADKKDPNVEILLAMLDLICALLGCDSGGDPLAPTPMLGEPLLPAYAVAEMNDQINAYGSLGPLPSLSPEQRAQGRSDASSFLGFLGANSYLVPDGLRNSYSNMLSGLINDL